MILESKLNSSISLFTIDDGTMDKRVRDIELQNEQINARSEEVQDIVERMPTHWVGWLALCIGILICLIVLLGFFIRYSDTVDGNVSVTASAAPVRLVSHSTGRLLLLKQNHSKVKKGEIIAFIDNGADYRHILFVEQLLNELYRTNIATVSCPETLTLGEISTAYNSFVVSLHAYQRLLASDVYATMQQSLQKKIESDEQLIQNLNENLTLKEKILTTSLQQLQKDSILYSIKGISEQELQNKHATYLSSKEGRINVENSRQMKISEIRHNKLEIQRIILEEMESKEKIWTELTTRKNELINAISMWKEQYLISSPIDGELEYLGFWRTNGFVQSGQELLTVIPNRSNIIGEVEIPSYGAGKVKIGQEANVKLNNYPYDEYGLLKGTVLSVSRLSKHMKTSNGEADVYMVTISFPNGLTTNFGQKLILDFETKGTVEIITKPKRLIERLFDNLKAKAEK